MKIKEKEERKRQLAAKRAALRQKVQIPTTTMPQRKLNYVPDHILKAYEEFTRNAPHKIKK